MKNFSYRFGFYAISLAFLVGTTNAVKFESIYLSDNMQECVNSMGLEFSPLTSRIAEDERLKSSSYFINPFRNIDRSIRMLDSIPSCLNRYNAFRADALNDLNQYGTINVYGRHMRYFTDQPEFNLGN